jgi:NTP pyrophosphatase (non-canonical NTP hydrolase)
MSDILTWPEPEAASRHKKRLSPSWPSQYARKPANWAICWPRSGRVRMVHAEQIAGEMADVRVYLELLSRYLGIDLDAACAAKAVEVQERLESGADTASRR